MLCEQKFYEDFKAFELESKNKFITQPSAFNPELTLRSHVQRSESCIIKKAKLLIYQHYKAKGSMIYNEISARKGSEPGAPTADLLDIKRNLCIELFWNSKKSAHPQMLKRLERYKKIFGSCILVFLSWGKGNAFKKAQGFTYITEFSRERYNKAGIKVVFFNIDKPDFSWIQI